MSHTNSDTIAYRYIGVDGAFHEGIPARDLTIADVRNLPREMRGAVRTSLLYKRVVTERVARDGVEEGGVRESLGAVEAKEIVESLGGEPETVTIVEVADKEEEESSAENDEGPEDKPSRRRNKKGE